MHQSTYRPSAQQAEPLEFPCKISSLSALFDVLRYW